MHKEIIIFGRSSKKIIARLEVREDETLDLMTFLRNNNIPIASSCYGEGVCNKCIINETLLTCQISVKDYLNAYKDATINVSYL